MWMTPLVQVLLKKRARLTVRGVEGDSLILLTARIGKIILENRMALASGKKGSWAWWKNIDVLTHRKDNCNLYISYKDFIHGLNTYFGRLCYDKDYIEPTLIEISDNAPVPQLTMPMVYNALISNIKRTAMGPDGILYWVWNDYANILTPMVERVWSFSLRTQCWPKSWKESNINPIPKVEAPVNDVDFRGINVTSVIAPAFERVVYSVFNKKDLEAYLGENQSAYRSGGSCINALLKTQYD